MTIYTSLSSRAFYTKKYFGWVQEGVKWTFKLFCKKWLKQWIFPQESIYYNFCFRTEKKKSIEIENQSNNFTVHTINQFNSKINWIIFLLENPVREANQLVCQNSEFNFLKFKLEKFNQLNMQNNQFSFQQNKNTEKWLIETLNQRIEFIKIIQVSRNDRFM